MAVRFSNPSTMPPPRGYTMVVEATGPGRTLYIAGQLGMTADGQFAGAPGDFRAQATQCFENMKLALESVGAGFKDVVKITNFFIDMDASADLLRGARQVREHQGAAGLDRDPDFAGWRATARCSRSRRSRWCRRRRQSGEASRARKKAQDTALRFDSIVKQHVLGRHSGHAEGAIRIRCKHRTLAEFRVLSFVSPGMTAGVSQRFAAGCLETDRRRLSLFPFPHEGMERREAPGSLRGSPETATRRRFRDPSDLRGWGSRGARALCEEPCASRRSIRPSI